MSHVLAHYFILTGLILTLAAGLQDLFTRKISNWFSAALAAIGLVYTLSFDLEHLLRHVGSTVIVFLFCLLLYRRKFFGGGDAKLLTALSIWFAFEQLPLLVIWTMMCGGAAGLLTLAYTMFRRALNRDYHMVPGVPYGVGIAGGFLVAVGQLVQ